MPNWTDQQLEAICARGSSLLVSAAAGSGKTAVLVERIIRRVVQDGIDVDRMLVVTFTRAAAAQMKQRIADALDKLLIQDPNNEHLQRQTALVHLAPISTIDSFCLDIVREYIHLTDLDPDFRVADEGENALLAQDVLAQLLEEKYAQADPAFLALADNFEPGLKEGDLGSSVLSLYRFSQAYPWPSQWREQALAPYTADTPEKLESAEWIKSTVSYVQTLANDAAQRLRRCLEEVPDSRKGYGEVLESDLVYLTSLAQASSYSTLQRAAVSRDSWPVMRRKKGDDPESYERAKEVRDSIRKQFRDKVIPAYLEMEPEQLCALIARSAPTARSLVALTDEFEERFAAARRDRSMADFSDIEHYALQILVEHTPEGDRPKEAAAAVASRFDEIMIDEYQDSNMVQELLLGAISGEGQGLTPNRFMVGDVKQSIYRFRQAMPELFISKYHAYAAAPGVPGRNVELYHNFRSRAEVIEGVNMLFRQLMREDIGGVNYDEEAALHAAAPYREGDDAHFRANEIWLVTESEADGQESAEEDADTQPGVPEDNLSEEEISSDEREARIAARRIRCMVGRDRIWDEQKQQYRPVGYGDIAVLLRAATGHADVFVKTFADAGIPAYCGGGTGYFKAQEVALVLDYLNVIDNPLQDIPLMAVLRSPMGDFTDEEIARIHIEGEGSSLWEKLLCCCTSDPDAKTDRFAAQTLRLRTQARDLPLHELIWRMIDGTHFLDYVTALPAGEQRRANLDMLIEKAVSFERGSYSGLFRFLRYVEQLKKYEIDSGEAPVGGLESGSVQIMSIHKSKGLEFPVVFVCGLGRNFNQSDSKGNLICHADMGIGVRVIDPERHVRLSSPVCAAIGTRTLMDARGEELRVLYVALTRAKEKLILMGSCGKSTDMKRWLSGQQDEEGILPFTVRAQARRPMDLIMSAALSHRSSDPFRSSQLVEAADPAAVSYDDGCGFEIRKADTDTVDELLADPEEKTGERSNWQADAQWADGENSECFDLDTARQLQQLAQQYRSRPVSADIPGKVSVSYLKAEAYEQEQERIYQLAPDYVPSETVQDQPAVSTSSMGAAQRGTLVHTFMQYLDYPALRSGQGFERQLDWLVKCGKIADGERTELKSELFASFFASALCERMGQAASAGLLFREQPFVLGCAARDLKAQWDSDETVLVQGIIDAWFIEDGEIVLIDYKTDRVPDGDAQSLVRKYRMQLQQYAAALERLTGKRVKERLIWSFALGRQIDCA